MLVRPVKPQGPKPQDRNGNVQFGKFKDDREKGKNEIKEQINSKFNEGESVETIAEWFCKKVDEDKIGKGNAYFDALIQIIKSIYLSGEPIEKYEELIGEILNRFEAMNGEKIKRGDVHLENMQKRFRENGLSIEFE